MTPTRCLTLVVAVGGLVWMAAGVAAPKESPGYGTEHPTVLCATDPRGQWIVMCQVRADTDGDGKVTARGSQHGEIHGDEIRPYVILEPGAGNAIGDYVAHDRSGRWLAVIRDGKLVLIDTRARKEWDLSARGASTDDADDTFGPHSAASFDAGGRSCHYVRRVDGKVVVVVHDLATHEERVVDPGPGLFERAWLDPAGAWVAVRVVAKDTDGNGKLELPDIGTSLSPRRCRGEILSYSTYGFQGDRPALRFAPVAGGAAVDVDGLLAPIGDALLRRREDGALVLRAMAGQEREVAPAAFGALLFARSAETDAFVIAGASEGGSRPLWLLNGEKRVRLPVRRHADEDEETILHGRWWPCTEESPETAIADLARGEILRVPGRVVAHDGDRVLLSRDDETIVRDLVTGKEWPVEGAFTGGWRTLQEGPALAEAGQMVHLAEPARSGAYEGEALAIAEDGRVLVASGKQGELDLGPLRWVTPKPR